MVVAAIVLATGCSGGSKRSNATSAAGIHKIRHIVVIMQENRSFDTYFGTYPGADGIPMQNGVPTVCVNDPRHAHLHQAVRRSPRCQRGRSARGGERGRRRSTAARWTASSTRPSAARPKCANVDDPSCANPNTPDIMGYHTQSDIPNYWSYAQQFRAAGPHVLIGRVRGACPRTSTTSRHGRRAARPEEPSSCTTERDQGRRRPKNEARQRPIRSSRGPISPICCTRRTCRGLTTS